MNSLPSAATLFHLIGDRAIEEAVKVITENENLKDIRQSIGSPPKPIIVLFSNESDISDSDISTINKKTLKVYKDLGLRHLELVKSFQFPSLPLPRLMLERDGTYVLVPRFFQGLSAMVKGYWVDGEREVVGCLDLTPRGYYDEDEGGKKVSKIPYYLHTKLDNVAEILEAMNFLTKIFNENTTKTAKVVIVLSVEATGLKEGLLSALMEFATTMMYTEKAGIGVEWAMVLMKNYLRYCNAGKGEPTQPPPSFTKLASECVTHML